MSEYTDAVEAGLARVTHAAVGECPGCERCAEHHDMAPEEHVKAWRAGTIDEMVSFSWRPCGICGTTLGGNRCAWHWIRGGDEHGKGGEVVHEDDMCTDCVLFIAYGDEPESWRAKP